MTNSFCGCIAKITLVPTGTCKQRFCTLGASLRSQTYVCRIFDARYLIKRQTLYDFHLLNIGPRDLIFYVHTPEGGGCSCTSNEVWSFYVKIMARRAKYKHQCWQGCQWQRRFTKHDGIYSLAFTPNKPIKLQWRTCFSSCLVTMISGSSLLTDWSFSQDDNCFSCSNTCLKIAMIELYYCTVAEY